MLSAPSSLSLDELRARLGGANARVVGPGSIRVTSLTEDSRQVSPGALFVARAGAHFPADRFVLDAQERGAVAILCEEGSGISVRPRLECSSLRYGFGVVAQALAGDPSARLRVVGITGTNGKTTTSALVASALGRLGQKVATLGTLGFFIDGVAQYDTLTTPQPDRLAQAFASAEAAGVSHLVMEVSSHALAQGRVCGVQFRVAAFSNLSQDHLDYHETMDAYAEAKALLFGGDLGQPLFRGDPGQRVLNVDDAFGRVLAGRHEGALLVSSRGNRTAELLARDVSVDHEGLAALLQRGQSQVKIRSRLVGTHNLDNLLLATGIVVSLGWSLEEAAPAVAGAADVPGRLERCDQPGDDVICVVDYAHTPDALRNVLRAARDLAPSRLVCVFGCGGDRDRTKRPLMGEAAATLADEIWVTSDNPRSEAPEAILADIRPGTQAGRARVHEVADRRAAIRQAVLSAPAKSVVVVAGKGHETYQLVGDQVLSFDDRVEVREALARRRGGGS